jgi:predicted RNA-binding protein with PIN domain
MLLIDGYNLMMAGGKPVPRRRFEGARRRLIERLDGFARARRARCEVVFDGGGPGIPHSEWLTVRYAPDADAAIVARIQAEGDRTALTIVTDDRAIVEAARAKRIKVVSSREFARRLEPAPSAATAPDPKRRGISPGEAEAWMKEFGL